MDPVTGRFVSEDPGKNGGNWYAYCGNSPTNGGDITGKNWVLDAIGEIAKACGGNAPYYVVSSLLAYWSTILYGGGKTQVCSGYSTLAEGEMMKMNGSDPLSAAVWEEAGDALEAEGQKQLQSGFLAEISGILCMADSILVSALGPDAVDYYKGIGEQLGAL
jgi:hypothetical protein